MSANPTATLVILPGLDGGAGLARPFVDCLPSTLVPLALDLPADGPRDARRLREWVDARLPREAPFFLLGQSWTTLLAVELARCAPVRGLILVAPPLFRRGRRGLATALRFTPGFLLGRRPPRWAVRRLLLGPDAPPDLLDAFDAAVAAVPAGLLADRLQEFGRLLAGAAAPALPCPTLCLHAEQDRLLAGPIPTADTRSTRHVTLSGPHLLLWCRPAAVVAAVALFLEGLADGG